MDHSDKLIRVFVGTEIACLALLAELEAIGVPGMIKNEWQSAINAGYGSGSPSALDLYIPESGLELARPVLEDFIKDNPF